MLAFLCYCFNRKIIAVFWLTRIGMLSIDLDVRFWPGSPWVQNSIFHRSCVYFAGSWVPRRIQFLVLRLGTIWCGWRTSAITTSMPLPEKYFGYIWVDGFWGKCKKSDAHIWKVCVVVKCRLDRQSLPWNSIRISKHLVSWRKISIILLLYHDWTSHSGT